MCAPEPVRVENGLAMNVAIAPPLGKLARHHPKKRVTIGRFQGVGVLEIHLVLEIGVLVIALIDAPAQASSASLSARRNPKAPEIPL